MIRGERSEFVKRVYKCQIEGHGVALRPPVGWIGWVNKYMKETRKEGRVSIDVARQEYINRKKQRLLPRPPPTQGIPRGNKPSELWREMEIAV